MPLEMPTTYGHTCIVRIDKFSLTCPLGAAGALDMWVKNKNTKKILTSNLHELVNYSLSCGFLFPVYHTERQKSFVYN